MKRSGSVVLVAGVVAALAVAVVALGRWEEHRSARDEMRSMHAVLFAIGDLSKRRPTGYRIGPPNCLSYATPGNLYGLQVCFDDVGRVVETVDRRPVQPKYASLNYDPRLSTIRVPLVLIRALFALPHIPQHG